jgi:copper resistance protein C
MSLKRLIVVSLAACAVFLLPRVALAHAHLLSSTPAANAAVHGPDVAIHLKFNSRVETRGSAISVVLPGGQTQALAVQGENDNVSIDAHAHLGPGSYTLRWQALSTDGHITRGEIPFSVR